MKMAHDACVSYIIIIYGSLAHGSVHLVMPLGIRSLENGKATDSSILAWRIPWHHKELDKNERLSVSGIRTQ